MSPASSALSGLPEPFVDALKKLFEILDKESSGWIDVEDIIDRWNPHAENNEHLPKNVVESFRKVANSEGKLSFERFCAGIKISILRHEAAKKKKQNGSESKGNFASAPYQSQQDEAVITSSPLANRTSSLPNLFTEDGSRLQMYPGELSIVPPSPVPSEPVIGSGSNFTEQGLLAMGPPKPPRDPVRTSSGNLSYLTVLPVEQWNESKFNANQVGTTSFQIHDSQFPDHSGSHSRRHSVRRQNSHSRRHTLQGGIDVSMMKRLRQLELEKSVLQEGLQVIDASREWYMKRLDDVHENLRNGIRAHATTPAMYSEAMEERLMFELQSIRELNQRLRRLAESDRRSFPTHIDLQITGRPSVQENSSKGGDSASNLLLLRQIERLKEQNKMLTMEVGRKSNFITNLEQEKSALIRQLFQARSFPRSGGATPQPPSFHQQATKPESGQISRSESESTFM